MDRAGPARRGAGGEGVPAAGEERAARDGRGDRGLADLGVRRRAADHGPRRRGPALVLVLRLGRGADRDRADAAADAAGRGRHGRGEPAAAAPAPGAARREGGLPLRSGLDLPGPRGAGLSARLLALLVALALLAHAALLVARRFQAFVPGSRASGGRSRSARAALRDLERAGGDGLSKEQAAALVEKALHEAFGELDERDESERARAVRALLDDVRFVRYAPQLGDYSQKLRELAARGAETVRRWA